MAPAATTTLPTTPILNPTSSTPPIHHSHSMSSIHTISSLSHPHQPPAPLLILIAGAPCSGKKSVLNALRDKLHSLSNNTLNIAILHMSDFHVPLSDDEEHRLSKREGGRDMECLEAFELSLLISVISEIGKLGAGSGAGGAQCPKWDYKMRKRVWGPVELTPASEGVIPDVIIAEGHFLFCEPKLVELASVKIFTETDPDVRLARRVIRDTAPPYSIPLETIFDTHVRFGKPAAEITIQPTKVMADIILPKGAEGPGVELIAHGVYDDLNLLRGKGRGGGKGDRELGLYSGMAVGTTLKEADLMGVTSSLAYYETV